MAFGDVKGTLSGGATSIPVGGAMVANTVAGTPTAAIGDLIVVGVAEMTANTVTSVSDNLGGSAYTAQNAGTLSTVAGRVFWKIADVAGAITSVTGTGTASTDDFAVEAAVITGPFAGTPLDQSPSNASGGTTSPFSAPATGTLSQANELVVSVFMLTRGQTNTAATSPLLLAGNATSTTANTANSCSVAIGTKVVSSASTTTPQFTNASGTLNSSVLMTMTFRGGGPAAIVPVDEPNPTRPISRQSALLSQPLGAPLQETTLRNQDKIYGNAGQVPDYDWPNPVIRHGLSRIITNIASVGLLLTTLAPVFAGPFNQDDWPNPRGPVSDAARLSQDRVTSFNAPLVVASVTPRAAVTTPFFPRRVQQPDQPANLAITSVQPVPFSQDDWPNSRGYPPRQDYQQSLNLGLLTTTGTKPFLLTEWPNPVLRPVYRLVTDPPNLAGALLPPFSQDDWPNPRGAARLTTQYEWPTDLGLLTTTGTVPFSQDDWPNPRGYPPRQDYQQSLNLGLLTTTGTKPFAQGDWPNPRPPAPRVVADYYQATNLGLLTTTGTKPFLLTEWPVPRGPRPLVVDYQQSIDVALALAQQAPFSQDDWPNPRGYAPRQDYQQSINLGLLTTTGTKPFAQDEWANPRGAVRPPAGYEQALNFRLLTVAAPFAQIDWPNPYQLVGRVLVEQPPNLAGALLSPFGQDDWPTVRALLPRPDYQQSLNLGLLTTTGTKPFAQSDWPVPKGAPPRSDYSQPLNLGLLTTTGTKPAHQLDWPNPRGYAPRQDFQASLNLGLALLQPFSQTNWPVPRGAAPRPDYLQVVNLGLLTTTGTAPFVQTDWPLPLRYWPTYRIWNDPTGAVLRLRRIHPAPTSVGSEGISPSTVTGEMITVVGAVQEGVSSPSVTGESAG